MKFSSPTRAVPKVTRKRPQLLNEIILSHSVNGKSTGIDFPFLQLHFSTIAQRTDERLGFQDGDSRQRLVTAEDQISTL